MAQISMYDRGTTYISVYITGLDSSYSRNDRYIRWWFNGNYSHQENLSNNVSTSIPTDFTELSPNTSYSFGAVIFYTDYEGGPYNTSTLTDQYFSTLSNPRPSYFYWSSYGTGYSPQNRSVSSGKIAVYRPYATAFNALRTNIINMLVYKGIIVSADFFMSSNYYFATVSSGNAITAALYNKAASGINAMGGSVPSVTGGVGGTALTENYFYYLQYYINNIT